MLYYGNCCGDNFSDFWYLNDDTILIYTRQGKRGREKEMWTIFDY